PGRRPPRPVLLRARGRPEAGAGHRLGVRGRQPRAAAGPGTAESVRRDPHASPRRAAAVTRARGPLAVNAKHVVHSGDSGNNGGYHTNPLPLEGPPNEVPS